VNIEYKWNEFGIFRWYRLFQYGARGSFVGIDLFLVLLPLGTVEHNLEGRGVKFSEPNSFIAEYACKVNF